LISSSDLSTAARTPARVVSSRAAALAGLARLTSISVRISVSGVRSSCEALATNRRWLANAASSRASIASNVSASSFSPPILLIAETFLVQDTRMKDPAGKDIVNVFGGIKWGWRLRSMR
jgi:hypothetical protein